MCSCWTAERLCTLDTLIYLLEGCCGNLCSAFTLSASLSALWLAS